MKVAQSISHTFCRIRVRSRAGLPHRHSRHQLTNTHMSERKYCEIFVILSTYIFSNKKGTILSHILSAASAYVPRAEFQSRHQPTKTHEWQEIYCEHYNFFFPIKKGPFCLTHFLPRLRTFPGRTVPKPPAASTPLLGPQTCAPYAPHTGAAYPAVARVSGYQAPARVCGNQKCTIYISGNLR